MKKMKKVILSILCSIMLCCVCIGMVGCDKEQITENTKTIIDASTDIIPVEYSKDLSVNILVSAYNKSLNQNAYKSVYSGLGINKGMIVSTFEAEGYKFYKDNKNIYTYSTSDDKTHVCTEIGENYYDLNLDDKTYKISNEYMQYFFVPQKSAVGNVVNGKYYQGQDHIYTVLESATNIVYCDIIVENGLIVQINQSIFLDELMYGMISQTFIYGDEFYDNMPVIPTTIEDYTAA